MSEWLDGPENVFLHFVNVSRFLPVVSVKPQPYDIFAKGLSATGPNLV